MNARLPTPLPAPGLSEEDAFGLLERTDLSEMMAEARALRDEGFGALLTYSKKLFIPLTHLCRDVCHYCTFATTPRHQKAPYMSVDAVLEAARQGAAAGCKEALFTLGEKPELRYRAAREALETLGFPSTTAYLAHVAERVLAETGLLPHLNPGTLSDEEFRALKPLGPSMGMMLESTSLRLCEKGMPHYGSPDKDPAVRLATLDAAGQAAVPFTTGLLIGIGETRRERIETLLAIRASHARYGHIQEVIVQNFRAKADTKMAGAPEPSLEELLWTIAAARLIFGSTMSIQAPPNLSPGVLPQLVDAGLNDWGGVSPVTPDFVNPEAPWPHLDRLAEETAAAGKQLTERLTVYPRYLQNHPRWLDPAVAARVLPMADGAGLARTDTWTPGATEPPPTRDLQALRRLNVKPRQEIQALLAQAEAGEALSESAIVTLLEARGDDFAAVCQSADRLRRAHAGDTVRYVVNRNINYTNVCYFKCQFCAFSKGKLAENLRGRPYDLSGEEIARRVDEAWARGATEVCLQGGIHPEYTGETYRDILRTVRGAAPDMHIHAFSPLEIWQGAETLGLSLEAYLAMLKAEGLSTLPGTAAEILDDEVRAVLCPDKINSAQWLQVMRAAHDAGLRSTATMMFGHVDRYDHWARHLLKIRALQAETGGFTEFVLLPFVAEEAPLYLKGRARRGPTFRETLLAHAVARLVLSPLIPNIQCSWVKLGHDGVAAALQAGCNDLGGTLMNETITRAAGAQHGQETGPSAMRALIEGLGRRAEQRSTLYEPVSEERIRAGLTAGPLIPVINTPATRYERSKATEAEDLGAR